MVGGRIIEKFKRGKHLCVCVCVCVCVCMYVYVHVRENEQGIRGGGGGLISPFLYFDFLKKIYCFIFRMLIPHLCVGFIVPLRMSAALGNGVPLQGKEPFLQLLLPPSRPDAHISPCTHSQLCLYHDRLPSRCGALRRL